jgi:hypothetical protein
MQKHVFSNLERIREENPKGCGGQCDETTRRDKEHDRLYCYPTRSLSGLNGFSQSRYSVYNDYSFAFRSP